MAVHCHNTLGGQGIDVGISAERRFPRPEVADDLFPGEDQENRVLIGRVTLSNRLRPAVWIVALGLAAATPAS